MKNCIKALRKARGLRQEDLAELLGVSRQTIIAMENDKYDPSLALAMRLARLLETTVEEVFYLEAERCPGPAVLVRDSVLFTGKNPACASVVFVLCYKMRKNVRTVKTIRARAEFQMAALSRREEKGP